MVTQFSLMCPGISLRKDVKLKKTNFPLKSDHKPVTTISSMTKYSCPKKVKTVLNMWWEGGAMAPNKSECTLLVVGGTIVQRPQP